MMAPLRVILMAALFAAVQACAGDWSFPPIDGELSGELLPKFLPHAPPVRWKVRAERTSGNSRHLVVGAEASGLHLEGEIDLNLVTGEGRWTLKEGVIDVKTWGDAVLGRFAAAKDLEVAGLVKVTGSGLLHGSEPSGSIEVVWSNGSLASPGEGWSCEGIDVDAALAFDGIRGPARSTRPATLSVRTITTRRFGARNFRITGELKDLDTFLATNTAIEIAGGFMSAAPFTMTLRPVALEVDLQLNRIGLQDVAALVPTAVADASGRVDGAVHLGWKEGVGFELGDGHLTLRSDEPARVRLHPSPGLITAGIPRYVRKFFYPGLDEAELGQVPLRADSIDVNFSPKPDAEGRTAVITFTGVPDAPKAKAPVLFQVNVHGPLQTFVKLGTTSGVSLRLR